MRAELVDAEPWMTNWAARHRDGLQHALAWLAAGKPIVDRTHVFVSGDPAIAAVVRRVIAILPDAVVWRLVTGNVQIWCGRAFNDPDPESAGVQGRCDSTRDPLRVAVLVASEEVTAHELGHAWCSVPHIAFQGLSDEERARLHVALHTDVDEQEADRIADLNMRDERAADCLASLWLGRRVDTTSGHLRDLRRRRIRAAYGHHSPDGAMMKADPQP